MAMMTYLVAFAHFSSEIFIFRTARLTGPVMSTVIVSSQSHRSYRAFAFIPGLFSLMCRCQFAALSMTWMITQYDFYVKQS